jgi:DNA-binding MarR family transcriptional regulator
MSEYAVERARQIFQARQTRARGPRLAEPEPGAAPDGDAETGDLIGALHLIHSRLRRLDGWLREEHQLNLTEMHVLSMIPAAPSATPAAGRGEAAARLARAVELSPSGLTRLVDRLVTRGLVARVADAWDGRVTHLVLTERGRDVRDAVLPRAVERIRDSCGESRPPLDRLYALVALPADGRARRDGRRPRGLG